MHTIDIRAVINIVESLVGVRWTRENLRKRWRHGDESSIVRCDDQLQEATRVEGMRKLNSFESSSTTPVNKMERAAGRALFKDDVDTRA